LKVLIVDDHAGMRALIREMIGSIASEVRECQSGEEAVQVCGNFRPDVVTMDLQMGDMDGMTALRLLRAFHPQAHLIVVTQFDGHALRQRVRSAGANFFVLKDELMSLAEHLSQLNKAAAPRARVSVASLD
jgi:two-component system chemotaxis response regulator CheY